MLLVDLAEVDYDFACRIVHGADENLVRLAILDDRVVAEIGSTVLGRVGVAGAGVRIVVETIDIREICGVGARVRHFNRRLLVVPIEVAHSGIIGTDDVIDEGDPLGRIGSSDRAGAQVARTARLTRVGDILEFELNRRRRYVARREIELELTVLPNTEVARIRGSNYRSIGRIARRLGGDCGLARLPHSVGESRHCAVAPCLEDYRHIAHSRLAVVADREIDHRHRIFLERHVFEAEGCDSIRTCAGADFGEVGPAVVICVAERIPDIAVGISAAIDGHGGEVVFPAVVDEVVVGYETNAVFIEGFADVHFLGDVYTIDLERLVGLVEVVEAVGGDRAGIVNLELETRQLVGEIFRPVGESVTVFISELRRLALEVEAVRIIIAHAIAERRVVPRVGRRIALIIFLEDGKLGAYYGDIG